jgi:hypothetical protein
MEADATVAHSLYRRAVGEADHLPDTTACIFWLRNRRKDLWRDRVDVAGLHPPTQDARSGRRLPG